MRKQESNKKPQKDKQTLKQTAPEQDIPFKEVLDLQLIMGDDASGDHLAKLSAYLELKPEKIEQMSTNADLDFSTLSNDTILRFDFVTQEGREKEAIEYFENGLDRYPRDEYDPNLSPLQNWFTRPTHQGKLELFESKRQDGKRGVTLLYRIYTSEKDDINDIRELLSKMEETQLRPDARLEMELRGHLDTFKKNRIRIRMDYIRAHLFSKEFRLAALMQLMRAMKMFGDEEEAVQQVVGNPLFKLLLRTQEVQGTVRMASLRKMLELYKIGVEGNTQVKSERESPEIIKGLFKGEVRFTFIFESRVGIAANFHYQSESILIRLLSGLKKYAELFD